MAKKGRHVKGTLEKRGGTWLARWKVNGKRFTRSTGCKVSGGKAARQAAEEKLNEFTHDYTLKDEKFGCSSKSGTGLMDVSNISLLDAA